MKHLVPILLVTMFTISCIDEPEFIKDEAYSDNEYAFFDFKSTSATTITLSLQDEDGAPFHGVKVTLWSVENDQPAEILFTAFTDSHGEINSSIDLPKVIEDAIIQTNTIGIPNNIRVPVENHRIEMVFADDEINSAVIEEQESNTSSSRRLR